MQIMHFFGNILDKIKKKTDEKQHPMMVLFGTNLVSNISTKAEKTL
jgi:hypothetical protein